MFARDWSSSSTRIYANGTGVFNTTGTESDYHIPRGDANSGNTFAKSRVEFNSSLVARSGTTTHGKQKGVKFIIKVL